MKRWIFAVLLGLILFVPAAPTAAESPLATWGLCRAHSGDFSVSYTINVNSLQVESFTTVNNSDEYGYMRVAEDDGATIIFAMLTPPHTTDTQLISNFKFRRIPSTDHDDPNSVRYPQGVRIGCRWPA